MTYIYLKTKYVSINNPRLRYVIEFINQHPVWPKECRITIDHPKSTNHICIEYSNSRRDESNYFIPSDDLLFANRHFLFTNSFQSGKYYYNDFILHSFERSKRSKAFVENKLYGFDILETIFYHTSRYEEYNVNLNDCDFRGMLKEDELFLVRENLEQIPVVDHIIFCFAHSLGLQPVKFKTQITMSHDVDHLNKFDSFLKFLRLQGGLLKRRNFTKLYTQASQYFENINPYDSFKELLTHEDIPKYIFYLIGGKSRYDVVRDVDDKLFLQSIASAKSHGYQIGIHPGFDSTLSVQQIINEKEKLERVIGQDIYISRNHFLRFLFPMTLENLEAAGIKADHSLGYRRRVGFRCGTGFPYKLYNLQRDMISNITAFPLIIMDQCLVDTSISSDVSVDIIHGKFIEANQNLTMISYNFHNSIFDFAEMRNVDLKSLYHKIEYH